MGAPSSSSSFLNAEGAKTNKSGVFALQERALVMVSRVEETMSSVLLRGRSNCLANDRTSSFLFINSTLINVVDRYYSGVKMLRPY